MMGLLRRVAAAVGVLTLCWTTGCDGFWVAVGNSSGSSTSPTNNYVYVANSNSSGSSLIGFAVGTGTLTEVTGSTYTLNFVPSALVVTPTNTFLYLSGTNGIYGFSIGTGGALTQLSGGSALEPVNVVSMDVSPNGLWLLGLDANSLTPTIDEFQINTTTGALTQWNTVYYNGTFSGSIVPSDIKVAPNGNLVFAALGTAGDVVFTLNSAASSGILVSAGQVAEPTVTTDLALAVGPDSSTLYIARSSGGTGNLVTYSVNANGVPTTSLPLTTSPAGAKPFSVVTDTAGANVYVADRTGGKIYGFGSTMNSGTLAVTAQSVSPYTAGTLVTALVVDSSGDYLLAISDGGTPDLAMYPFDKTTPGNLDLPLSVSTGTPEPAGAVAIATTH